MPLVVTKKAMMLFCMSWCVSSRVPARFLVWSLHLNSPAIPVAYGFFFTSCPNHCEVIYTAAMFHHIGNFISVVDSDDSCMKLVSVWSPLGEEQFYN